MKVIVNGKKEEVLELIDHRTKLDCASDIIGNHGGLSDGQFRYDEDLSAYHCDQATFEWWSRVLADHQRLNDRIAELKEEYGSERVQDAIGSAGDCDLEDQPAAIHAALDEAFASGN